MLNVRSNSDRAVSLWLWVWMVAFWRVERAPIGFLMVLLADAHARSVDTTAVMILWGEKQRMAAGEVSGSPLWARKGGEGRRSADVSSHAWRCCVGEAGVVEVGG